MRVINNTLKNQRDIIIGLLIYNYAQQSYLKDVKMEDKNGKIKKLSDEEIYESVVGLLSKGALYVRLLEDGCLTIEPITDAEKWEPVKRFEEVFKGKFKELQQIQNEIDKYKGE